MVMEEAGGNLKFSPGDGYAEDKQNYIVVDIQGAQHMNFTDLNTIIL